MNPNKITPELIIESNLMTNLEQLGYLPRLDIKNDWDIEQNIKIHLERLNNISITNEEFEIYILKVIKNLSVYEAAKKLRDRFIIIRGTHDNLRLACIDQKIDNNIFEYSHQIKSQSEYKNIGDVTIFMNGFPICQVELKRVDVEINQAYNQIVKYKLENFDKNIFKFIQIYVVSNNTSSRYFANNNFNHFTKSKSIMFPWSDWDNKRCNELNQFTNSFLNHNTIFKLINQYTVFKEETKEIIILRPYQYHAVESVINKIVSTNDLNNTIKDLDERANKLNGFIFHATGSGKTLTSFKVCQIISETLNLKKVIFLVDRLDLNAQTMQEFKKFSSEELDETESSRHLEKQLSDPNIELIVTTIQKLDRLLKKNHEAYKTKYANIVNSDIIFVIDECHRTQFGEMHKLICKTFLKSRLIGFTGTPIFTASPSNLQKTSDIFGEELHRYMMSDAIFDGNVLGFQIEYAAGPKIKMVVENDVDKEVEKLDKAGFFNSSKYIDIIVDFIALNNEKKTMGKMKSMLTTSGIPNAINYYKTFRQKYPKFKIAVLFSYVDNDKNILKNEHSKHELENIIKDFNMIYRKDYSTKTFKEYTYAIQNDLKDSHGKIELVIVVNMLTTGFDCKEINTIYLDKTLKTHNLIQTISRANRIYYSDKRYANIVSFRTFRSDVDYAVALYNNNQTIGYVEKDTLDDFIKKVNDEVNKLKINWPIPEDIMSKTSQFKKEFMISMRIINKFLAIAMTFINFDFKDLVITRDELERYRNVQKDIGLRIKEKIIEDPILDDIDFELDFSTDKIDVDYIMSLVGEVYIDAKDFNNQINEIIEQIKRIGLKSKRELLESFIVLWSEKMKSNEDHSWKEKSIKMAFSEYKIEKILPIINDYVKKYHIDLERFKNILFKYQFEGKDINSYSSEIRKSITKNIGLLEQNKLVENIMLFMLKMKDTYDSSDILESNNTKGVKNG